MVLLTLVLLALGKNLLIRGPIALARLLVRRVFLSHFELAVWADPVRLDVHLSIVHQVVLGTDLQASERLSAKAGSAHQLLSFPGRSALMARLDIGPFSFRIFGD